jgi:Chaperone for flagella basal body P-ring formation
MSIDLQAKAAKPAPAPGSREATTGTPITPVPAQPRIPGRRNPRWIALGLVALCLGALLSYVIYSRVAAETPVVIMAHTLYRGETVDASDLAITRLSGETAAKSVSASQLRTLVGQKAVYDLPKGTILTPGAIADVVVPADGRSVVGIKLATGRAPAVLLTPGSRIRLVALPAPSTSATSTSESTESDKLGGKTYPATVIDQVPGADGASILINADVKSGQAPTIAMLAASDRIVVVRDPAR